jgi:hypothetical protein
MSNHQLDHESLYFNSKKQSGEEQQYLPEVKETETPKREDRAKSPWDIQIISLP